MNLATLECTYRFCISRSFLFLISKPVGSNRCERSTKIQHPKTHHFVCTYFNDLRFSEYANAKQCINEI